MLTLLIIFILIGIIVLPLFNYVNLKSNEKKSNESNLNLNEIKMYKPNQLTDFYSDIGLEPYGCFSSLDEKFFQKKYNPYNKTFNSLVILSNENDIKQFVIKVINNGYDIYGSSILKKYPNLSEIKLQEIATLAKLSGYNYISVYKINIDSVPKFYLTYSPPLDDEENEKIENNNVSETGGIILSKPDKLLSNFTLMPKIGNYTNEEENTKNKELSCGFPCLSNGKPQTIGDKQFMCGSVGYPNIKTPSRFAVYKITEK